METYDKLTLTEAARVTPGRPHASTLFRWATRGQNGVRLQIWRYGRRIFTTKEALDSFAEAVTRASVEATPSTRTA